MSDFERNLRNQLRSSEQQLDADVLQRLRDARGKAVARNAAPRLPRVLLPLGGMTLASMAALFLIFSPLHPTAERATDTRATDAVEAQDLDFYYWLAETQDVSDS